MQENSTFAFRYFTKAIQRTSRALCNSLLYKDGLLVTFDGRFDTLEGAKHFAEAIKPDLADGPILLVRLGYRVSVSQATNDT